MTLALQCFVGALSLQAACLTTARLVMFLLVPSSDTLYLLFGEWLLAKADGETLADQAAYHVGIRGVHFMGSLFVGLIHLPVSTIVTKVMTIHYSFFPPPPSFIFLFIFSTTADPPFRTCAPLSAESTPRRLR